MKTTLLAALTLDGGWIVPPPKELASFLRLAGKGPVWSDLKRAGLQKAPLPELVTRLSTESLTLLGTPELNAAVLKLKKPMRLLLWWRPELTAGPRQTLVKPGAAPARFTLRATRKLGAGIVGIYER